MAQIRLTAQRRMILRPRNHHKTRVIPVYIRPWKPRGKRLILDFAPFCCQTSTEGLWDQTDPALQLLPHRPLSVFYKLVVKKVLDRGQKAAHVDLLWEDAVGTGAGGDLSIQVPLYAEQEGLFRTIRA